MIEILVLMCYNKKMKFSERCEKMEIVTYNEIYKHEVIQLILDIQNQEAGIGLSLEEQPDLNDIETFYMKSGGGFWTALNDENEVIGTIGLINKKNGCGVLKKFFVRSDYRSQKVGFRLYRKLIDFCLANQFDTLILDTPSVAKTSHKFYERNGFFRIVKEELPVPYDYPDRNSYLYKKNL